VPFSNKHASSTPADTSKRVCGSDTTSGHLECFPHSRSARELSNPAPPPLFPYGKADMGHKNTLHLAVSNREPYSVVSTCPSSTNLNPRRRLITSTNNNPYIFSLSLATYARIARLVNPSLCSLPLRFVPALRGMTKSIPEPRFPLSPFAPCRICTLGYRLAALTSPSHLRSALHL
jgi:hypothetical protein